MPRLFLSLLPLYALLFLLIIVAILIGHQQPPSVWAQILHLEECELPCWIGIVPGQTTLIEAQNHIKRVYGNTSEYQLEERSAYAFKVIYAVTGESFLIAFLPEELITRMFLLPYPEYVSSKRGPTIPDLYSSLGNPETVNLVSGLATYKVTLIYKDPRIQLRMPDLVVCAKASLTQEIDGLALYAGLPTYGYGWLSDSQQWRGFGRCYNFKLKSP